MGSNFHCDFGQKGNVDAPNQQNLRRVEDYIEDLLEAQILQQKHPAASERDVRGAKHVQHATDLYERTDWEV